MAKKAKPSAVGTGYYIFKTNMRFTNQQIIQFGPHIKAGKLSPYSQQSIQQHPLLAGSASMSVGSKAFLEYPDLTPSQPSSTLYSPLCTRS